MNKKIDSNLIIIYLVLGTAIIYLIVLMMWYLRTGSHYNITHKNKCKVNKNKQTKPTPHPFPPKKDHKNIRNNRFYRDFMWICMFFCSRLMLLLML